MGRWKPSNRAALNEARAYRELNNAQIDIIERLKAENAKLREERDHWHVEQVHAYGNWEDAHKRALELEAENTKLRELVRHLYECMCNVDDDGNFECDSCEYDSAEGKCDFERRMRELRVEVDG